MPEPEITCRWCGQTIQRVSFPDVRGVGWLSIRARFRADAPIALRCSDDPESPAHQPDIPDMADEVEVEAWLAGVREGL